jgi:predicted DNA-binding antitoxin AbrB/MazE fold protein
MALTVEATYENGTLKLARPLPLREHEQVRVTVETVEPSPLLRAYGIMCWKGSAEESEYFATSPELDFPPPSQP